MRFVLSERWTRKGVNPLDEVSASMWRVELVLFGRWKRKEAKSFIRDYDFQEILLGG